MWAGWSGLLGFGSEGGEAWLRREGMMETRRRRSHVQHLPERPQKPTADLSINTGGNIGDSMSEISVSYLPFQIKCPIDLP
jgi:hypothetical protein